MQVINTREQYTYVSPRQVRKERLDVEARSIHCQSGGKFGTIRQQLEASDNQKDNAVVIVEGGTNLLYDGKSISGQI